MTHQTNEGSNQRRGFFRRAGIFTAMVALVTAAGSIGWQAHAHGGPGMRGGLFGHGGGQMDATQLEQRTEGMLKHLYARIDATPEQQQKLAPIVKQAAREMQPLRAQMHAARQQAAALMSAETIDRAAIERARAESLQTAEAVSRRMTQALADAAEVLTPAQRKTLAEHMQHRRGMARHGMKHQG